MGKVSSTSFRTMLKLADVLAKLSPGRPRNLIDILAYCSRGSALHAAAYNGNLLAVRELLAQGADVNCQEHPYGMSPLHLAVMQGHVQVANELIQAGAQRDALDAKRRSVGFWAARRNRGHEKEEIVALLQPHVPLLVNTPTKQMQTTPGQV